MRTARRIEAIPPYLFAEIDRKIAERKAAGVDVISFGIGDPDLPTPDFVVEELARAASDPSTHQYPSYFGLPSFRRAIADFYRRRFGIELDPDTQVLPLLGSKEGIAHLPWAFVDPGDQVLVTEPGYPVYEVGTILAGGEPVYLPLTAEDGWFPDFAAVDPATVVLELTETLAPADDRASRAVVDGMRAMGFHVWFDDFGSGWSAGAK